MKMIPSGRIVAWGIFVLCMAIGYAIKTGDAGGGILIVGVGAFTYWFVDLLF